MDVVMFKLNKYLNRRCLPPQLQRLWYWLKGFVRLMVSQYQAKECQKSAASLTYMTLFATVPMMTVTYAMFSIIPAFRDLGGQLQVLMLEHFLPHSEQELIKYLSRFTEQARQMTALGLAFLLVSAYLMLKNIEQNFNSIWGVVRGRRGVANFLLYWAILSLGPLLLGLALAMSTYLASFRLLVGTYDSLGLMEWVFQLGPWLLTWAAFTLLFVAVPNCKVQVSHAIVGGFFTTLGFQVLKAIFGWIVGHSSFTLVYGAFAALPLFLLWVNLSWTVILGGAVFVHAIDSHQIGLRDRNYPDLYAALLLLWQFHLASAKGARLSEPMLMRKGLSAKQWQRIRDALLKHHVITPTQQGEFVLCYDLKLLNLKQLASMLDMPRQLPKESPSRVEHLPWRAEAIKHLKAIDEHTDQALDINVDALFRTRTELRTHTEARANAVGIVPDGVIKLKGVTKSEKN